MQKPLWLLTLMLLPAIVLAEPLRVFASVLPIQNFVERIGGRHVDARVMVRPGYNPQTYDPSPQQIAALAGAMLYVRTGVPFEKAWMARLQSANPGMRVFDAREGIALREMEAHSHDEAGHNTDQPAAYGHDAAHGGGHEHLDEHEQDPHVWTAPPLAKHMAAGILDTLIELDPVHTADYRLNHDAFVAELEALDSELHALLDPLPNRRFMVFHPAWGYFADAYGLTQVPIEREGKEPGARALAALIDQAGKDGIKVVFVQPQFDGRRARQVAQAIGGAVIRVDPLAHDYVGNLRRVGREFAQALQR